MSSLGGLVLNWAEWVALVIAVQVRNAAVSVRV